MNAVILIIIKNKNINMLMIGLSIRTYNIPTINNLKK